LLVVVFALTVGTDSAHGYEVPRSVELAIAGPRESLSAVFTAGSFDGCGTAVTGVVVAGQEATDIPGVTQNLGRQQWADAVHAGEGRATGGHGGLDLCGIGG
jgi:hypothetical protein